MSRNRLAVVTGANSGIGKSIVKTLSREGWRIVLSGRNETRLRETAGGNDIIVTGDLNSPSTIKKLVQTVQETRSPLQLLVNNAGIVHRTGFIETSDESWMEQMDTNFMSAVRLTRALLRFFADRETSIINVSSTLGIRPIQDHSAYSASKAAMNNWTQSLALELAPRIRVNAVCPGLVDTPIQPFHGEKDSSSSRQSAHALQPLGRMGRPEDIAEMVAYLASDKAAWITGSIFTVDGGISLRS